MYENLNLIIIIIDAISIKRSTQKYKRHYQNYQNNCKNRSAEACSLKTVAHHVIATKTLDMNPLFRRW